MARIPRSLLAGYCYHVINRGNRKRTIFHRPADFDAFVTLLGKARERVPMRLLAVCLMPNHFHFIVRPYADGELSRFMHWLTTTHVVRYSRAHDIVGRIWQGRFKSFPIQEDSHLLSGMRYVERNALRAGLVRRAEAWAWGSLAWRHMPDPPLAIEEPPGGLPANWTEWVNLPQSAVELDALRECIRRERPFGEPGWTRDTAQRLGLRPALRRWRRRKSKA